MTIDQLIGVHPKVPHPCGTLSAKDGLTHHQLAHRQLDATTLDEAGFAEATGQWLVNHHLSDESVKRDRARRDALERLGLKDPTTRLPSNDSTQKGNWAEILLAEYVQASNRFTLPVYRLRYNPNVDQSMKGDDVLAFDFHSQPIRILVGEAKFRSTPSKTVVEEIIASLERSHHGNVPASLQFVADRLFDAGNSDLGYKVSECNGLFATGVLSLVYVGLLVSTSQAHHHVHANATSTLTPLVVLSVGLGSPSKIVEDSFSHARKLIL